MLLRQMHFSLVVVLQVVIHLVENSVNFVILLDLLGVQPLVLRLILDDFFEFADFEVLLLNDLPQSLYFQLVIAACIQSRLD